MSEVALAKLCRRADVPIPGRGYWARIESGHSSNERRSQQLPKDCRSYWEFGGSPSTNLRDTEACESGMIARLAEG